MLEVLATWAAACAAVLSGVLWVKTARAEVPALPGITNMGSGFGGYLTTKNDKGDLVDLHKTYKLQSRWNSHAAYASALSAGFAALALVLHRYGL